MKALEFICLLFLVIMITSSAIIELKHYHHIECFNHAISIDDCVADTANYNLIK